MLIYFATCKDIPAGTKDDALVVHMLKKMGHQVEYHSWDQDISWEKADKVVIRSTWDYHKNLEKFKTWLDEVAKVSEFINPVPTLKWNSDKLYLNEINDSYQTSFCRKDEVRPIIEKLLSAHSKIVLKPTVSASSYGLLKIDHKTNLEFIDTLSSDCDYMIQPFMDSIIQDGEVSLIYFMVQGELVFSHSAVKLPSHGEFRVQQEFGGSLEPIELPKELIHFGREILIALKKDFSFVRLDLVDWKTRPKVSEVELIEPDLYLRSHSSSAELFARSIIN